MCRNEVLSQYGKRRVKKRGTCPAKHAPGNPEDKKSSGYSWSLINSCLWLVNSQIVATLRTSHLQRHGSGRIQVTLVASGCVPLYWSLKSHMAANQKLLCEESSCPCCFMTNQVMTPSSEWSVLLASLLRLNLRIVKVRSRHANKSACMKQRLFLMNGIQ